MTVFCSGTVEAVVKKKRSWGGGGGETGGQEAKEAGDDGMIGREMKESEQRW